MRPWNDTEIYFDPEVAQGVPLSGLAGLGGFTNGEIARTAGPTPTLYRARLFLRHTWGLGGGTEALESDANQLAGIVDKRRVVLTAGNVSETYYSIHAARALWISVDYQHVNNPGYNGARGPVNVWSARVHTEF